jgi:hypothetical protein
MQRKSRMPRLILSGCRCRELLLAVFSHSKLLKRKEIGQNKKNRLVVVKNPRGVVLCFVGKITAHSTQHSFDGFLLSFQVGIQVA